jgi:hypothetical protein
VASGDVHTVYKNGKWLNEKEGGKRPLRGRFDRKSDAQQAGRDRARQDKVEHLIHKKDGTIGDRHSYGHDPVRRPG